jgi:tetratricopeptide (TPR) repeat protein
VAHARSLFAPGAGQWRGRWLIWEATARMARARPLLGWGTGGVQARYLGFQGALLALPRYADQPYRSTAHSHQDALQFLAERGVAGLGLFLWLGVAAAAWFRGTVRTPASSSAACALAGWLADGLVNGPLHVPPSSGLWWVLLGIALRDDGAGEARRPAGVVNPGQVPCLAAAAVCLVFARAPARDLAGEAYFQRGSVALDGGEPGRALPDLVRAAALAFEDRREHFEAGRAWFLLGAYGDAAREFACDVARNPSVHSGWHNLGLSLLKLGRRPEALAAFGEAAALNPRDPDTRRMAAAPGPLPRHGKL